MKKTTIMTLALLMAAILLVSACSSVQESEEGTTTRQGQEVAIAEEQEEKSTPVEIAEAGSGDISLVFSYAGNLKAKDEVDVVPGINGRVEKLLVEVGDEVEKGDVIAKVEQDRYLAQLKQAEAALATAKLNLQKMELGGRPEEIAVAEAGVELARAALNDVATIDDNERTRAAAELARTESALKQAQAEYDKIAWAGDVGETPQALALEQATVAYENALANYNIDVNPGDATLAPLMLQLARAELELILKRQPYRQVDFEIAKAGVSQAQAAVDLAEIQLEDTAIQAPFSGVVAEVYISEGSMVGQGPIARFISGQLEVEIEVEEKRIGEIFEGQQAALQVTAYPDKTFSATVTSVAPSADTETRTFTVKVTPIDEASQLKGGMFADVSVLAEERKNVTLVPVDAVTLIDDQEVVYVVVDGRVERRDVETGLSDGTNIEILSGIEPGAEVVIAGQPNLTDGVKVEVVNRL